jgi:antitoxin ChpS
MHLRIRKVGNSAAVLLPQPLLSRLRLGIGGHLEADVEDGILTMKPTKPAYRLADLMAQCDLSAPAPDETRAWQDAQSVGREAW